MENCFQKRGIVQGNKLVQVAELAYSMAQKSFPLYTHPKSPSHYTFPQLAVSVLSVFYLMSGYEALATGDELNPGGTGPLQGPESYHSVSGLCRLRNQSFHTASSLNCFCS